MDVFVRALNALLMLALPLGVGIFLARRLEVGWNIFGIGMVGFGLSQMAHLPFNAWALNPVARRLGLIQAPQGWQLLGLALLFGLSAGVFEECTRYLIYWFWLRETRSWRAALMYGAGHGGLEAMLLGAFALYGLIQALALRDANLEALYPAGQVEQVASQLTAYWASPWYVALLGAVERISGLAFHLAASVLVMQSFIRRNGMWLGAAIVWHTLLNAMAVYAARVWGTIPAEAIILLMGLLSLGFVVALRPSEPEPGVSRPAGISVQVLLVDEEPTQEEIEDSRYV